MNRAGISTSVVASIATKPQQWEPILDWSRSIASKRIVPFASVHPDDPAARDHLRIIRDSGIRGIKLHPYYQEFELDEPRLYPLYEQLRDYGLVLLCHTGFDIAFERIRRADPRRIAAVHGDLPGLKLVTSHFGSWQDWDEVERRLLGRDIYMDISYSFPFMSRGKARKLLLGHPGEYLLFGSDSPWADQKVTLDFLTAFELEEERLRNVLYRNAAGLLRIDGEPRTKRERGE